jgi:hypothetical protein
MSRDHSARNLLFNFTNRTLYRNAVSQYQFRHVLRCAGEASKLHFIKKSGTGSILSPCQALSCQRVQRLHVSSHEVHHGRSYPFFRRCTFISECSKWVLGSEDLKILQIYRLLWYFGF